MRSAGDTRPVTTRLDPKALRCLHVLTDCVLVSLGWVGAYALRRALDGPLGYPINPFDTYLRALPLIVAPWMATCWAFGIYHGPRLKTLVDELQSLVRGVALGLLVVSAVSFFFRELEFGRFVVVASAGLNLVLQGASRAAFHRIERRLRRSGAHDVPALIVGSGVSAIRLLQKLQDHPEIGYRVVGFLDDPAAGADGKDVAGHPLLGRPEELRRVVQEFGIREVFVADPGLGHTRMLSLVLACEDLGVSFRVVTNLFEVLTAGTPLDLVDDLPLVQLGRQQTHRLYEPMKRVLDLAGASLGLLLTAPLLAWCAWRVRRTSPGPAFLRQTRVGRHGRPFEMYKLRTMRPDVGLYEVAPREAGDDRVTEYGRWLRVTSIDELPQLLNVLRGEMSLVGPRPEMPFIVDRYDEWQRRRLSVAPGITGLWQILGRKDLPMHENLQYDFYYIRNRSLALDLSILIRTAGAVLGRRGAF
jgi:exopolysaccharide biosynthesis polyprenyl glycosylphosphotransferase